MGKQCIGAAVLTVVLLMGIGLSTASAHPEDIVPRGHIAYDLLGSIAADSRLASLTLADFQRGDRLYTRREMAQLLLRLDPDLVSERHRTGLRLLQSEFAAELAILAPEQRFPAPREGTSVSYTAFGKLRALTDPAAAEITVRGSAVAPVGRDGFAVVSAGNYRDEWYNGLLLGNRTGYPAVETAYLRVNGRALDVSVGKMPVRWGPGFVGGLTFSDEAPTVPQVRIEKAFRFWGWLGKQLGPLYFSQFYGQFFENDDPTAPASARGTRRHLGGRRVETLGTRTNWQFSFGEAFKSTRLPDPIFSQIFPYFLYQNDWIDNDDVTYFRLFPFLVSDPQTDAAWINYIADITAGYRPDNRGTVLYAALMLDDVRSPEPISLDGRTPRKIGQQYGVYLPDLGGIGRYGLRLEYSTTDVATYRTVAEPSDWYWDGTPLGFPAGSNADVFFGRLDVAFDTRWKVAVEGVTRRRHKTNPGDEGRNADRVSLFASYAPVPHAFAGLRVEHQSFSLPGSPAERRTCLELNAGIGF
ncbi:MAG: hypothetical protein OHK0029_06460 [Armatimonadaceae bacterium]